MCGRDASLPDEVLYGRAGYLFSLLFVQKHLGDGKIDKDILNKVSKRFLKSFSSFNYIISVGEVKSLPFMSRYHSLLFHNAKLTIIYASEFSTGRVDYQPGIATLQGLYCNIRIPFRYQLSSSEESTTVLKKSLSVVHAGHASSQKKPSHMHYESTGLWPETPSSIYNMSLSQTSHNHTGLLIVKLLKIVLVCLGDTQGCR